MKHAPYEVFKHPAPEKGQKWAVQMPKGIVCFRTKRTATAFAIAMKPIEHDREWYEENDPQSLVDSLRGNPDPLT